MKNFWLTCLLALLTPYASGQGNGSLRDQYERSERQRQIAEQREQSERARIEAMRSDAERLGMWVSCEGEHTNVFHNGVVWWLYEEQLKYPVRYRLSGNVVTWTSSLAGIPHELHLDSMQKYDGLGVRLGNPPWRCRITRGSRQAL